MKKILVGLSIIGTLFISGCATPSKAYENLVYVDKFETSESGTLLQFKDDHGKKYMFNVNSEDKLFLHKGDKYDLIISAETWYQFADYINGIKESK